MSPYENRLRSESFRRVGLIALVKPGSETAVGEVTQSRPDDLVARLAAMQIANLSLFLKQIGERTYLFAFLEYQGADLEAVPGILRGEPWIVRLTPHLEAHSRATPAGSPWLRMELMNVIGPTLPLSAPPQPVARMGLMSGVKPDSEILYRTLASDQLAGSD
jgi:L-rhamnose mutarotase